MFAQHDENLRLRVSRWCRACLVIAAISAVTLTVASITAMKAQAAAAFSLSVERGTDNGGTQVSVKAPASLKFASVGVGTYHSVGITTDGNTYAWGYNALGQLGNGSTANSLIPVQVTTPQGVEFTSVYAAHNFTIAEGNDGNTYAWGDNTVGELGDGTYTQRNIPVQVQTPKGVKFTAISVGTGSEHILALGDDGVTYAWGDNSAGQLGIGSNQANSNIPVPVATPAGVHFTDVSAGASYSLALGDDGKAYGWGYNMVGTIGNGNYRSSTAPVAVSMPSGVTFTSISAGATHSLALGNDGHLYAWGQNNFGQLGDGTNTDKTVPSPVPLPAGVSLTTVKAGTYFSLAQASDGTTYAWGYNRSGQLADGTNVNSSSPVTVAVPDGSHLVSIDVGMFSIFALGADGNTYAWGDNVFGQLGDNTTYSQWEPEIIDPFAPEISDISFDRVAGSGLDYDSESDTWQVITPAHAAGTVEVSIEWNLLGVAQTPALLAFTYVHSPTVTFDSQGGQPVNSQTVDNGSEFIEPANPSRVGYTFAGWNTKADGSGAVFDFAQPVYTDITLYAQWVIDTASENPAETQSGTQNSVNTQQQLAVTGSAVMIIAAIALALLLVSAGVVILRRMNQQ